LAHFARRLACVAWQISAVCSTFLVGFEGSTALLVGSEVYPVTIVNRTFARRVAVAGMIALSLSSVAQPSAPTPIVSPASRDDASSSAPRQTAYPGGIWEPGPAKFKPSAVETISIPMDDGASLEASFAYPVDLVTGQPAAGKFPVLIEMTPYSFATPLGRNAFFIEHGYIYAVVRPRGTAASTGQTQQFSSRDGLDGKAAVEWAAHRIGQSDGRVGLVGCSYPGGTALATAAQVGDASPVKAIITACGVNTGLQNTKSPMHLFEEGSGNWVNVRGYPLTQSYSKCAFASGESLRRSSSSEPGQYLLKWADPDSEQGKLRFETSAISAGGTLAGPMRVTVYARSNNRNLALLATLYDLAADGTARRITRGGILGSQHELNKKWSWTDSKGTMIWPWPTLERDEFLTPSHIYRFDIALPPGSGVSRQGTGYGLN
jgi:predicted acyl esterase